MLADFTLQENIRPVNPAYLLDSGPPEPLYKVNPRLIKGKAWWDNRRKQAYKEFGYRCAACGKTNTTFEAHELYDVDSYNGIAQLKDVIALCKDCHSFIHQNLHRAMLARNDIKFSDIQRILAHGNKVLKKAGLRYIKPVIDTAKVKFGDWRMVIDGVAHAPIFKEVKNGNSK